MDFRSLTYFVTVARELNFTHAAEKLNISQPPLSNQIKLMEEDLGVQLFIRGKRHLQLTEAGRILYRRAEQMLALASDARSELKTLGDELSGRIRLGMVEGRAPFLAARWISGFQEEFPLVTYSVWNGSSDDVIERLARGLVDLGVIAAPYDAEHLEGICVGREPWSAMIPADFPQAAGDDPMIPLAALADVPLIVPERASRLEAVLRWFESIGKEPKILCTLSSYIDALALAEEGAGICIFPQTTRTPNPRVVSKVITDPVKMAEYVLVWEKERPPRGLALEFVNFVRDILEAEGVMHAVDPEGGAAQIPEGAELL